MAAETGDRTLLAACRRIWNRLVERRMHLTGGIGPSRRNEGFTFDWDLPDETAYLETCAAIALVFFAQRMLGIERDGRYADVAERALYNGVLAGIGLDGVSFFYANPLAAHPFVSPHLSETLPPNPDTVHYRRSAWFGCACCPPNIARLLASLPSYLYGARGKELYVHHYAAGRMTAEVGGHGITVTQETDYPWDERIRLRIDADAAAAWTLALRIPGWCRGATLDVNGEAVAVDDICTRGYARLQRT
ncbi:MAG: beta-L-arabinofuranosidase domain-containing protein [Planctomycetota bacterium]